MEAARTTYFQASSCMAVRYVVTGGLGFVGSRLVGRLLADGHSVTVLDARRPPCGGLPPGAEAVRADVADPRAVGPAVRRADGVFHLAALGPAARSVPKPADYGRVNVGGTRAVFAAARAAGVPAVLASSAAVYGRACHGPASSPAPFSEGGPCEPAGPYGLSKLEAERSALSSGAAAVCLRYFNVYGPSPSSPAGGAGVVARFAARLSADRPPAISGAGTQVRDYVHLDDVVDATMRAAKWAAERGGSPQAVFNIGTGRGTTLLCLAGMMARAASPDRPLDPEFAPPVPGDVAYSVADTRRARRVLGWEHRTHLADGLRECLASQAAAGARR